MPEKKRVTSVRGVGPAHSLWTHMDAAAFSAPMSAAGTYWRTGDQAEADGLRQVEVS
ncbi:MAG: hypothetical protein ACJ736_14625 [Streptomyces sp.]